MSSDLDLNLERRTFVIVVVDDEESNRANIVTSLQKIGLHHHYVQLKTFAKASEWENQWNKWKEENTDSIHHWINLLDCHLEGSSMWAGIHIWGVLSLHFKDNPERCFIRIFSGQNKVLDLVKQAGPAADLMNPQIIEFGSTDYEQRAMRMNACYENAVAFIRTTRKRILARVPLNQRRDILKKVDNLIQQAQDPSKASDLSKQLDAERIHESPDDDIGWTLASLFPIETERLDSGRMTAGEKAVDILGRIRGELQQRLAPELRNVMRFVFDDLTGSPNPQERALGGQLAITPHGHRHLSHLVADLYQAGAGTPIRRSTNSWPVWESFEPIIRGILVAYSRSLQAIIDDLPGQACRQAIESDSLVAQFILLGTSPDLPLRLCQLVRIIKQYPVRFPVRFGFTRVFTEFPITPDILIGWENCLRAQRKMYDPGMATERNEIYWHYNQAARQLIGMFQTQRHDEGAILDTHRIRDRLLDEAHDPKPEHLSGLRQTLCHELGGRFILAQGRSGQGHTVGIRVDATRIDFCGTPSRPEWTVTDMQRETEIDDIQLDNEHYPSWEPPYYETLRGTWYILIIPAFREDRR